MKSTGLVVVGSGPAGVSAAEAFRHHNPDDPIRIVTDDPALPYARPPLSKEFLRGDAKPADIELHSIAPDSSTTATASPCGTSATAAQSVCSP